LSAEAGTAQPRVWLVLGDKLGDNAQVETVARALGWACERKTLHMRPPYAVAKPKVKASLYHLDLERCDPLEPPWPDLILTIGRRPSMAALWIREQSGKKTKIVLLGKPSSKLDPYDLIIASAENQLPPLPNVLPIGLPLMRLDQGAIATAATVWQPHFADLPRPLIAILIGGPTGPFLFDASVTERLLATVNSVVADQGGTAYLTTSRRTPADTVATLAARLPSGARLFQWQPDAGENPYRGLLGLADGFIVTEDSISMLVEAAQLGKPLFIFPLPRSRLGALDQWRRGITRWLFAPASATAGARWRRRLAIAAYRVGIFNQTRDFTALYQLLLERNLAVPLGQDFTGPAGQVPNDLPEVVARIRALIRG